MRDTIEEYRARPMRYDNIDGTVELFFGAMMLGFAVLGYIQANLPEDSIWATNRWASLLLLEAVPLAACVIAGLGTRAIKRHITHPRTGYVARQRVTRNPKKVVVIAVTFVVAAILAYFVMRLSLRHSTAALNRAAFSSAMVASYGLFAFRMGGGHLWKCAVAGLPAVALAVITLAVPGDMVPFSRAAFPLIGGVWLGSGLLTLWLYIRRARVAE